MYLITYRVHFYSMWHRTKILVMHLALSGEQINIFTIRVLKIYTRLTRACGKNKNVIV